MQQMPERIVIVGAGQAGFQLAASLREEGFAGSVTLIGDEPDLPYQRPPLSKAYLKGEVDESKLHFRTEAFFALHRLALRRGERVESLDRPRQRVSLASGETLAYDHLVLATGARNRTLDIPGAGLDGVVQLRSRADADALRQRLGAARKLAIVGAGFIGLECAAVARAKGVAVTVVESAWRPMPRALSVETSQAFHRLHAQQGAELIYGDTVSAFLGEAGRVTRVATAGGQSFAADLALVGIGVLPNVELAADAGLVTANGIVVDEALLTEDPAISAIGDCANYRSSFADGAFVRLESVQNAVDQARCVASRLVGRPKPYASVPWFWSDQGKTRLQIAGLCIPHEQTVLRRGAREGAFSVFCFRRGRLIGVESVNSPADHMAARRLLGGGPEISPEQVASPSFDLRAAVGAAVARSPAQ
ncbi:MAG: NAD(P)/FAD-dependent oxidoreductase [Hyphomicrobiales bacterium]